MNSIAKTAVKTLGRMKGSWRLFYFAMRRIKSQHHREWLWKGLSRNGVVAKMCDEGYWKITTLLYAGEVYALPGKGGGINSVIRWQQMHWQSPLKATCADKIAVRSFVREKIGSKYLVPMLPTEGIFWTDPDEINFDVLPNRFVLKLNNGSGMNLLVTDKSTLDISAAREKMRGWMKLDFASRFREWHYRDIHNRIYCEAFIETPAGEPPPDYKFMCSNGKVLFAWVDTDRFKGHRRDVYDIDFRRLDVRIAYSPSGKSLDKPKDWEEMLSLAARLSEGIPIVRVDFYDTSDGVRFGEMTFTSDAALGKYEPFSWAQEMAGKIDLKGIPLVRS